MFRSQGQHPKKSLISAACIHSLVLSVTSEHRWEHEHIDWPINKEPRLLTQLSLHHRKPMQRLHHCRPCSHPTICQAPASGLFVVKASLWELRRWSLNYPKHLSPPSKTRWTALLTCSTERVEPEWTFHLENAFQTWTQDVVPNVLNRNASFHSDLMTNSCLTLWHCLSGEEILHPQIW